MKREIIFLNGEKAIDYKVGLKKDKSLIIAEVRKLKANKQIKSFNKKEGITGIKYEIKLKDDETISIALSKEDRYNITVLDTIMNLKRIYQDEAVISFNGDKVVISSRETGIVQGEKDTDLIMSLLRSMHNTKEITSVIKSGTKMFTYAIETKENERLRIQVDKKDPFVKELDSFTNIYVKKNKLKKALIKTALTAGTIAVIAATPYTRGTITKTYTEVKQNVTSYLEAQSEKSEMMAKWPYLNSCALRLSDDRISKEDYLNFMDELYSMIRYYEANYTEEELKLNEDYAKLMSWDELVSEKYQDMMNRRVY